MRLRLSRRDTIKQVLNSSIRIIKGGLERSDALLSWETHRHQLSDLGLIGRSRLIIIFFLFFFFLGLRDWNLHFFFNFGLWLRFLTTSTCTLTCVITTKKSDSFSPSFSIWSSLVVVFPLKIIFWESAARPFSFYNFCLRFPIYFKAIVLFH